MARIKIENESAIKLQTCVRGRQARMEKRHRKRDRMLYEKSKKRAALVIQVRKDIFILL